MASQERQPVRDEAAAQIATLASTPRDFIRDPVMLEFLGLHHKGKLLESNLEDALISHLQAFLLKCFVLFELKTDDLTHQDIGQMDMYVRMYDDLRRGAQDNPTVGIILCARKDKSVVRYSVLHGHEQLFATKYKLVLPSEEELRAELVREQNMLAEQTIDHPDSDE